MFGKLLPYDFNAEQYIQKAGLTGSQVAAVNILVQELKQYNLWDKMEGVFPFINSTAENLKTPFLPQVSGETGNYWVGFQGPVTIDADGVRTGTGGTATGGGTGHIWIRNARPTFFAVDRFNMHIAASVVNVTASNPDATILGTIWTSAGGTKFATSLGSDNLGYNTWINGQEGSTAIKGVEGNIYSGTGTKGNYMATITGLGGNDYQVTAYKNGVAISSATGGYNGGLTANTDLYVGAMNSGTGGGPGLPIDYFNGKIGFVSFGEKLSSTDAVNLSNAIDRFFDILSRGKDPNAMTYINAVLAAGGSLSSTQKEAINTLFFNLKASGIYNKLWSMFPFAGGNAASHAINALNPGSRNLTFVGGWTHDQNGAEGNNTDTAAKTGYVANFNYGTTGTSWGWYNNKSVNLAGEEYIGSLNNAGPQRWMSVQLSSGRIDWGADSRLNINLSGGQTGMYILSGGYPSNQVSATKNSVYVGGGALNLTPVYEENPYELYIGALNLDDSVYGATDQRFCFYFIGTTLTDAEQVAFSNLINQFQVSFGRNSY